MVKCNYGAHFVGKIKGKDRCERIKGGIAPRRSPLYIPPWVRGDPRNPQNEVYLRYIVIKNAIVF